MNTKRHRITLEEKLIQIESVITEIVSENTNCKKSEWGILVSKWVIL